MPRNVRRLIVWFCAMIVLSMVAMGGWYLQRRLSAPRDSDVAGRHAVVRDELPAHSPDRIPNHSSETAYVGSQSCAECHAAQSQSYVQTAHSKSFRDVDIKTEPPNGEFKHASSGRIYHVFRQGTELHHQETLPLENGEERELSNYPIRYVVGSGHHALTYLVETNGFLVESPITWYASRKSWAMSPGFDSYNTGFARPIYFDCLFCHTGRVEPIDGSRSRMAIHASSIDCERCHGPGSLHVRMRRSGAEPNDDSDGTIVHPGRVAKGPREAICGQCHLHSDAEVDLPNHRIEDFRPGMSLQDFRLHFTLQVAGKPMTVVGHMEQMYLSRCYQASHSLTCTTCHDPHANPMVETRESYFRGKCLTCHSPQACGLPQADRLAKSATDNCVACHMPTGQTDVPHVAATHHRIAIHHSEPADSARHEIGTLVPIEDISHLPQAEQNRCLGMAYLNLSLRESRPEASEVYRQRAQEILENVLQQGLRDPELEAGLAELLRRQNPQRSLELANLALQSTPISPDVRVKALFALSDSYIALRQTDNAIAPLEQLVGLRRQAGDSFLLAVCRMRAGNVQGALEAAHRAAEIRPDQPNFHALLAELYQRTGQSGLADEHQRLERILSASRSGGAP